MPRHVEDFRSQDQGAEFQAANVLARSDVSGNSRDEQIAEPLVKDDFDGDSRIGTAQEGSKGCLFVRDCLDSLGVAMGGEWLT